MASITYNNKTNKEFGLILTNDVSHEISTNDIEALEIEGRDGAVLLDHQRLKPIEKAFPFVLKDEVYPATSKISEWLGAKGWRDLELSWDPNFVYKATVLKTLNIEEVVKRFGKLRVAFYVHPIKVYKDSRQLQSISNGQTVQNRGNVPSKPILEITGSGNAEITINERLTRLENLQGGVTIDMQNWLMHHNYVAQWDKLLRTESSDYPYLDVGSNRISWTGNISVKLAKYEGVKL